MDSQNHLPWDLFPRLTQTVERLAECHTVDEVRAAIAGEISVIREQPGCTRQTLRDYLRALSECFAANKPYSFVGYLVQGRIDEFHARLGR